MTEKKRRPVDGRASRQGDVKKSTRSDKAGSGPVSRQGGASIEVTR